MGKVFPTRYSAMTIFLLALSGAMLVPAGLQGQTAHKRASRQQNNLRQYLQSWVGSPNSDYNKETRYSSAFVDLSGHGAREVIVYLMGRQWCGSGGCTTLVLAPKDSSYKIVAKFSTTWPPIRVLKAKYHGWHDIAFEIHGGGILKPYEDAVSFNGKTYAARERRITHKVPGKIVISEAALGTAKRMYP